MKTDPYLPLSEDAQCAWEAGGREALTFGTGDNGPVCLMIGLLELSEGPTATILREHTNLTAERVRIVHKDWEPAGEETPLNLAIVRDRAQAIAHRRKATAVAPEDLLLALVDEEYEGSRLHHALYRASPSLNLTAVRAALPGTADEDAGSKAA